MIPRRASTIYAIALFLCLVLTGSVSVSRAAEKEDILNSRTLKVGDTAPEFVSKKIDGENFELGKYIGQKPILLFFWSFFCGPCREEMPVLQSIYDDIGKDKVIFVGINLDGEKLSKAIGQFMKDSGLDFITVFDELNGLEYKIADPYGVAGTPTIYAIGLDGKVSFSAVGRIEPEVLKEALQQSM